MNGRTEDKKADVVRGFFIIERRSNQEVVLSDHAQESNPSLLCGTLYVFGVSSTPAAGHAL